MRVAHAPRMPGVFSPPLRVSDPYMHHGTCVTYVPWCMSGLLTSDFLWSRWRRKRSRYSRRMRNPQFCVSGKRPMHHYLSPNLAHGVYLPSFKIKTANARVKYHKMHTGIAVFLKFGYNIRYQWMHLNHLLIYVELLASLPVGLTWLRSIAPVPMKKSCRIGRHQTTTQHNKARTGCIILGICCSILICR